MRAYLCAFSLVVVLVLCAANHLEAAAYDESDKYNYDYYQTITSKLKQQEQLKTLRETCPRFEDRRNEFIIDIKTSIDRGAKMIEAASTNDMLSCANLCCDHSSCDLGVFRVYSSSQKSVEHNCYLIKCGNPANCAMAHHKEFIALMFKLTQETDLSLSIGRENSPNNNNNPITQTDPNDEPINTDYTNDGPIDTVYNNEHNSYDKPQTDSYNESKTDSHTEPTQTDSHTVPTQTDSHVNPASTTTQATKTESKTIRPTQDPIPPHNSNSLLKNETTNQNDQYGNEITDQTGNETTDQTGNVTTDQTGNETTDQNGNETTDQTGNMTTDQTGNETTDQNGNETTNENGNETTNLNGTETTNQNGNEITNQNGSTSVGSLLIPSSVYHHDDDHLPTRDPCDIHGCNGGSGIIVISVVGGVAILVIFFVGLIVTRKLYSNRQKKHYHNVDYLINGMYT